MQYKHRKYNKNEYLLHATLESYLLILFTQFTFLGRIRNLLIRLIYLYKIFLIYK